MTGKTDIPAQLRAIKQHLRTIMNGPVSASMREKGLTYKVNFGVEVPRLSEWAQILPHDYQLAAALWKEDIRECRILAAMLMPADCFDAELAEVWVEQMRFAEEAELTVMNLFSRTEWASTKAFEWVAASDTMHQLCGYLLLARLFMKGMRPTERDARELTDQAQSLDADAPQALRRAAANAVNKLQLIEEGWL